MIDERFERGSNLTRVFVRENAHDRERVAAIRQRPFSDMLCEHAGRGLVVCDVQDPLNRA
jgi:hypothetical protein